LYQCPQCGNKISYLIDPCPHCSVNLSWIKGNPHKDSHRVIYKKG